MNYYSITYDLNNEKDYEKVFASIKAVSATQARPTKSQWVVKSNNDMQTVRQALINATDTDDKFLILPLAIDEFDFQGLVIEELALPLLKT